MAEVIDFRSALPCLNLRQAAQLLQKTERTTRAYCKREVDPLPVQRHGQGKALLFDLERVVAWIVRERLRDVHIDAEGAALDLNVERALLARAQRQLTVQTQAVRARDLVPQTEVVQWYGRLVSNMRQRLLSIPSRLGALHGAEVAGAATALIYEALNELGQPTEGAAA